MNSRRVYILSGLVLLLLQLVSDNFLELSSYVKLFFLHIVILNSPVTFSRIFLMIAAFVLGLSADLFSGGIIGLYAASLVPVAFLRNRILSITASKRIGNSNEDFYLEELPNSSIIPYYIVGTFIFVALHMGIESILAQDSIWFFLIRLTVSMIINALLTIGLTQFVFKR